VDGNGHCCADGQFDAVTLRQSLQTVAKWWNPTGRMGRLGCENRVCLKVFKLKSFKVQTLQPSNL